MSQNNKINLIELSNTLNNFLSEATENKTTHNTTEKETSQENTTKQEFNFQLKPIELASYLKEYILGQDEAIDMIATKICTHFNKMTYEKKHQKLEPIINKIKSNMLLVGPTGVGKTYMIKLIAHKIGVPCVKADATKFTETGYVGGDVEDLIRNLVDEAGGNVELAEYGIIYLDEIDKLASTTNLQGTDVSKRGVQHNLLKIMEESEVDLKNPMNITSQMKAAMQVYQTGKVDTTKINTKNILFVMSGAFQGLEDIIKKRLKYNALGFSQKQSSQAQQGPHTKNHLQEVQSEDLIEFGFESEFTGRIPIIAVLNTLTQKELFHILKAPKNSVIESKKRDFEAYGIEIEFDDAALELISIYASNKKTGARSLPSIIEKKLIQFEKQLPSTNIKYLKVNKELIENPKNYLNKILTQESAKQVTEFFKNTYNITLTFSEDAINYILELSQKTSCSSKQLIEDHLKNYEYGLRLAKKEHLTITRQLLENKGEYLESLIKHSYENTKT